MYSIVMLSVIYAQCHKQAVHAECRYAECRRYDIRNNDTLAPELVTEHLQFIK